MRPIRVLYLIDGLGSGGAQRQLVTLARAADRSLVEPEVAIYHPVHHFVPSLEEAGIPVHQVGERGGSEPALLRRMRSLFIEGRFDIVHAYMTRPGILARLAAIGLRRPAVIVSERSVRLGASRGLRALEQLLAPRAGAMIANASAIRDHIEAHVPAWRGHVVVVPNGIEWSEPTEEERERGVRFRAEHLADGRTRLLAAVARLVPEKNPGLLLDAVAGLSEDARRRLGIVWVGACRFPRFGEEIRAKAEALGLSGTIRFLGPTDDVRSVYLGSDAIVLTSDWEGFPNAVLEGLAHGLPAVSTCVGDVSDFVRGGESGWVVPAGDVEALRGALGACVTMDDAELHAMGEIGSAYVLEHYSSRRLFEHTLEVYNDVLAAGVSGGF